MKSMSPYKPRFLEKLPVLRGLVLNRSACFLSCEAEPKTNAPSFVLVHGTWAPRAPWTDQGSKLVSALLKTWPGCGLYRFEWSGTNGLRHRLLAAEILADELNAIMRINPASPICTIAHSHGGNIVAWAARRELRQPIAVALYMNTPFVHMLRPNALSESDILLRIALVMGTSLVAGMVGWPIVLRFFPGSLVAKTCVIAVALMAIVFVQRTVPVIILKWRVALLLATNGARAIKKDICANVVGDEPTAAFGGLYFSQWFGRRAVKCLAYATFMIGLLTAFDGLRDTANNVGTALNCFACGILVLTYWLMMSAYGLVQGLVTLDSQIAVTPAPFGNSAFITVCWRDNAVLHHSSIVTDDDALLAVTDALASALSS